MRAVAVGFVALALCTGCVQEASRRQPELQKQQLLPSPQLTIGLSASADDEVELQSARATRRDRGDIADGWTDGGALPSPLSGMGAFTYADALYLVGGTDAAGGPVTDVVSYFPLMADGTVDFTASTSLTPLPKALLGAATVEADGVVYVLGGFDPNPAAPSAVPDVSFAAIDGTNGTLGSWTAGTSLPTAREGAAAVAWRGWVYLLGGDNGNGSYFADVQRAPVMPDGSLGAWVMTGTLPPPSGGSGGRTQIAAAVHGDKLYIAGGSDASGSSQADVAVADIQDDGSLGLFVPLAPLPTGAAGAKLLAGAGSLFVLGGAPEGFVYQAPLFGDGSIGSWVAQPSLIGGTSDFGAYFAGGALHVVGGAIGQTRMATAQNAPLLKAQPIAATVDGGSLTHGWQFNAYAEYDGFLYLAGGPGEPSMTEVDVVPLGPDGSLGPATATTSVPTPVCSACATAYRGHLYVFGGFNTNNAGSGCSNATANAYVAAINPDGTLGAFSNVGPLPAALASCGAVAENGYVYVTSGDNPGAAIYSAQVQPNGAPPTPGSFSVAKAISPTFSVFRASNILIHRNRLYAISVQPPSSAQTDDYSAALNGDGTLGPFIGTGQFYPYPGPNGAVQFAQIDDDLYAAGTGQDGFNRADVRGAEFTLDGGVYGGANQFRSFAGFNLTHKSGAVVVHNGHLVGVGGYNSSPGKTETADLRLPGVLGSWSSAGSLPRPASGRIDAVAVAAAGELLVLGGEGDAGDRSSAVSEIDVGHPSDGGPPLWSSLSVTLPVPLSDHAAAVHGDTLYVAGGRDSTGTARSEVWATQIYPDGGLAGFAQAGDLGGARAGFGMAATQDELVVIAGENDAGIPLGTTLVAPFLDGGGLGPFSVGSLSPFAGRTRVRAIAHRGFVYLVGGERGGFTLSDVLVAPVGDGGLGAWSAVDDMPAGRVGHGLTEFGGHLYVVGGCESTTVPCPQATADVESAAFYADGTIGAWNELAGLGATQERAGTSAVVLGNTLYAVGGESGGTLAATVRRSAITPPAATGSYEKRVDLGQLSTVASITLEPGGGDPTRNGHFELRVRALADDGGLGPPFDLGSIAPGAGTPMPAELGPVQHLQLEVTFDDADSLVYGDASAVARDLNSLDISFTPVVGTTSSSSGGGSSNSSGSTGSSGSSGGTAASTGSTGSSSSSAGSSAGSSSGGNSTGSSGAGSTGSSTAGSSGAASAGGSTGGTDKADVIGCACGPGSGSGSGGPAAIGLALVALFGLGRKRSALLAALLVVSTASLAHAEGHKKRTRILVMQLGATYGVDPKIGEVITGRLAAQIQQQTGAQVLSTADVQAQLGLMKTKSMLGCKDDQCLAEIGGALGADYMVTGSLARVGHSLSFEAQVMNPAKCLVLRRYSDRIKGGSDDEFFDEADRAARALFPPGSIPRPDAPAFAQGTAENPQPAELAAAASPTAPDASTTRSAPPGDAASTSDDGAGWTVALGGASELNAKGGWGSLAVGRNFSRWASLTVAGLFTGAKNAGVQLDADFTPFFQRSPVRPVIGLEVPVLFADSVLVGVAPHVGMVWSPLDLLSFEVDVPVMFLANASADERSLYFLGQGSASIHF